MASPAYNMTPEEIERATGLALDRAQAAQAKRIEVTVETRETVLDPQPKKIRAVLGGGRAANDNGRSSDRGGSFYDDMQSAPGGVIDHASPAYVSPFDKNAATAKEPTTRSSGDLSAETTPTEILREPNDIENPVDSLNASPAQSSLPLVSQDGEPLGLLADTDETGSTGVAQTGLRAQRADQFDDFGEDVTGLSPEDRSSQARQTSVPGRSESQNQGQSAQTQQSLLRLENMLRERQKQFDDYAARIEKQKEKVKDAWKKKFLAYLTDLAQVMMRYAGFMLSITGGLWWILLIGVIIDLCLVLPFVAIICWVGAYKGIYRRKVEKDYKREKTTLNDLERAQSFIVKDMRVIRQAQSKLVEQEKMRQQSDAVRNSRRANQAPTVGGVPLAS